MNDKLRKMREGEKGRMNKLRLLCSCLCVVYSGQIRNTPLFETQGTFCLLYTSDAADE